MGYRIGKLERLPNKSYITSTEPYRVLATEIVLQAIADWQSLCRLEKEYRVDRQQSVNFTELQRFFRSDYCDLLLEGTGLTGEYILRELEDMRSASQYGMSQTTWQKRRKAGKNN